MILHFFPIMLYFHSGVLERKVVLAKNKLNGPGVISSLWFIIFYSKFHSIHEDAMNNRNVQRFNILLPSRNSFTDKMAILSRIIIMKRDITFSFPFPGNYVCCSFTRLYSRTKLIHKNCIPGHSASQHYDWVNLLN